LGQNLPPPEREREEQRKEGRGGKESLLVKYNKKTKQKST
jgi:hypothetical protein